MKRHLAAITAFILCAGLGGVQAQSGPPQGPDFNGPLARLFGAYTSFSATLDMQVTNASAGGNPMISIGKIAFSDGKSRFEVDVAKSAGGRLPPRQAAGLKSMGLDPAVLISRPDLKVAYLIYPGLNAYVETAVPDSAAAGQYKIETSELGRETVDGHACVKNQVVVTDDKGGRHEFTVWDATDLNHFPVKIESNEHGVETTLAFTDVKFDKVAPEQFEAPAGASKYGDVHSMLQSEFMKRALKNQNRGGGGQ